MSWCKIAVAEPIKQQPDYQNINLYPDDVHNNGTTAINIITTPPCTDDARRASIKRPFYMVVNKKNGSRHIIKAYLNCRAKKIIESKRDANATQRENRMINTLPCKPALDVV